MLIWAGLVMRGGDTIDVSFGGSKNENLPPTEALVVASEGGRRGGEKVAPDARHVRARHAAALVGDLDDHVLAEVGCTTP